MTIIERATPEIGTFQSPEAFAASIKPIKQRNMGFLSSISNEMKTELRKKYCAQSYRASNYTDALRRSADFWAIYEQVNRVFDPDDPVYSIINSGTALSTTADALTFQAGASGQGRILEFIIGGEATASAVNRIAINRAGTSITSNTAITPEKFNSRSPAVAGTYGKAGTQALVGNPMLSIAFNAFGGYIDWKAAPGEEIYYVNSEVVSVRSLSGTSTCSSTGIFEEL